MLPNKSEFTYSKFFDMLNNNSDLAINQTERIIIDYEIAVINSIRNKFSESILNGCYFHLCQSFWRNIQTTGLITTFSESKEFRISFRRVQCLAFLNLEEVDAVFIMIKSSSPVQLITFLNYVEKYYIGTLKQGRKSCRNQPMFPKKIWNVHERTLKDLPRTNNSLESWHKQFASDIRAHPSVNMIIENLELNKRIWKIL